MQNDNIELIRESSCILIGHKKWNINISYRNISPFTIVLLIANVDTRSEILTQLYTQVYENKYMHTMYAHAGSHTLSDNPRSIRIFFGSVYLSQTFISANVLRMLNEIHRCLLYSRDFFVRVSGWDPWTTHATRISGCIETRTRY